MLSSRIEEFSLLATKSILRCFPPKWFAFTAACRAHIFLVTCLLGRFPPLWLTKLMTFPCRNLFRVTAHIYSCHSAFKPGCLHYGCGTTSLYKDTHIVYSVYREALGEAHNSQINFRKESGFKGLCFKYDYSVTSI